MFIVIFQHDEDLSFMNWSIGPFNTKDEAERARLDFIRDMDEIDEFSAVYSGDVTQLLPYDQVVTLMGNSLREEQD